MKRRASSFGLDSLSQYNLNSALYASLFVFLLTCISPLPALASGGGEHAGISSLLFPTINFVTYLCLMTWLYINKVKPIMQKHKIDITNSLNKASDRLSNADKGLAEVKKRFALIDDECQEVQRKLDAETSELEQHILSEAEQMAKRIEDDTVKQVENYLMRASHEIRSEIVTQAVEKARFEIQNHLSDQEDVVVREQVLAAFN